MLTTLIFGVTARDAATFTVVSLIVIGVGLVASAVPAYRASGSILFRRSAPSKRARTWRPPCTPPNLSGANCTEPLVATPHAFLRP